MALNSFRETLMAQITLKELAERANTSIRSVNRALKGQEGLGEKKRAEILKLASELGYTPNIAARNLRLQRSNFVAVLSSHAYDNVNLRKVNDLVGKLKEHGFFPLLSMQPQSAEEAGQMLREWSGLVKYVVVLGSMKPEVLAACEKMPVHFILFDCAEPSRKCSRLLIDRSNGIRDGILCLGRSGRRKLARCGDIMSRQDGLEKAFRELKENEKMDYVFLKSPANFDDGLAIGEKLVASGADAVFFDTDRMALGFLKYAWLNNIRIPEDIAVIGFDDDPMGLQSCPSLSTVAHPIREMNSKIIELIENNVEYGGEFVFSTKFIRRESV
jgi:DNA-binding LacI/PurR family transcriptional regulator